MADQTNKKILVVEDELFLRELYVQILKDAGYMIDQASDGDEALIKMSEGGYDLVLLDIVLPKRDGIQILKELQKTPPKNPNHAVVVMSNIDKEATIAEGVSLGIVGHFIKSDYTPDKLLAEVQKILS
jgi:DNA-binding response OmpR family regulator